MHWQQILGRRAAWTTRAHQSALVMCVSIGGRFRIRLHNSAADAQDPRAEYVTFRPRSGAALCWAALCGFSRDADAFISGAGPLTRGVFGDRCV
jgi:hypothetical protein